MSEIAEGTLVTLRKPYIDAHADQPGFEWAKDGVVGIVAAVHTNYYSSPRERHFSRNGEVYSRTTYQVIWETPAGGTHTTYRMPVSHLKVAR